MYYLQSRYYDPVVKRFINADVAQAATASGDFLSKNLFAYCNNCPTIADDQNGEWLNVVIGAVVGGVAGLVGQVVSDGITSLATGTATVSNWQTYTGAFLGGVAGGAVLGATGNVAAANAVTGAVTTGAGLTIEKWTIKGYDKSWTEIAVNTVADGVISFGLGKAPGINKVTKGRNSWNAVYKSGLSKLRNGTAKRMSSRVILKGVGASIVGGFSLDAYYGVKQYGYNKVKDKLK